jgi:Secretion system C-terminal sorting domain/Putative carbohydrate metabolism domain
MKKLTTALLFLLISHISMAQKDSLKNGGFENWDTIDGYAQPSHWYSLNPLTLVGLDPTTNLTEDANSGKFAVKLESKTTSGEVLTGLLTSGPILDDKFNPGFDKIKIKFNSMPSALRVFYKGKPATKDTGSVLMVLTKWNPTKKKADTIATAGLFLTTEVKNYTMADLVFTYTIKTAPDSAFFIASSSLDGFNPTAGSTLYIDDMQLLYNNISINDAPEIANTNIYPNPATDKLYIDTDKEYSTLRLQNILGAIVYSEANMSAHHTIDISNFKKGVYLLQLTKNNGNSITKKIIIQ